MPIAHGATIGTCTSVNTFVGGQSCSPVCATGALLTRNASCDALGTFHRAVCAPKECTCQNGIRAVGASCTAQGEADCASCNSGYHLETDAGGSGAHLCKPDVCSCANGQHATGVSCTVHQGNQCASCQQGYYLNATSKDCQPCPAGTRQGAITNVGGASSCQKCPKGTAQPFTASLSCTVCAADHYADQMGQTTCEPQPTLSELKCAHADGQFPKRLPSRDKRRKCVPNPSCQDLDYHYTESGCKATCSVSLNDVTSPCHITREKFRQSPGCSSTCRRRRTSTLPRL